MKRILSLLFVLSTFLYSQDSFELEINPTGVTQLIIFQTSISSLEEGDQIGIFDSEGILNSGDCSSQYGELLVGPIAEISDGTWDGSQLNLTAIGSVDNCAFGGSQLPGWVDGNSVVVKVLRDGSIYDTNLTFSAGTGTFGDLFMAVSEVEVVGSEDTCEDDNDATAAFGGCAGAVAALGCDFVFGGSPISELCPETCGECDDTPPDGDITDGCDLPDYNLYLTSDGAVLYNSSSEIGGFQFDVNGATVSAASGGDSGDAGFVVSTGASTVLGFSFTGATFGPGCGTMVNLTLDGDATGLSGIVIADPLGNALDFEYYEGGEGEDLCEDETACNAGEEGDCEYAEENYDCDGNCAVETDCAGDCGGSAVVDECGECGGSGIPDGACDCDGNVDLGCGCGEDGPSGCDNECGSDAVVDECGECGGSGIPDGACDCDGNVDLGCGCGEDGPSGCDNECGSDAVVDECGVCGGDNSSCEDCAGVPNGNAELDECGVCDDDSSNDCVQDCNGDWGGLAEFDECGICGGDNSSCEDCAGVPNGDSVEDECGICDGDNSSCSGCMDDEAVNYDEDATIDDGTCEYPPPTPEEFAFNQSTLQAFYFIVDATFEGEPLEIGQDWIGAFNGDVCVGARLWNGSYTDIPAMGDDGADYTEGYLTTGTVPDFKVYDASSGEIYSTNITSEESLDWSNNGFFYIDQLNAVLIVTTSYSLDLHYGANLISFYALPEDASLDNVMLSLDGIVTGVIGEGVAASPNPVLGWVGSLDIIDPLSGYWVVVNSSSSLDISDALYTDPNSIYNLHYGANLISFPGEYPVDLGDALQGDFVSSINGIIGEGVAASPNPVLGWVGSLSQFQGGDGYWMKVSEAISFSFNLSSPRDNTEDENLIINHDFMFNQSSNQAFYFIESLSEGLSINENDYLLAYNNNVLVGSRKWNGEYTDIPVMGNDGNSYSLGYCDEGDVPEIKLYRSSTGEILDLIADIEPFKNNQIYMLNNIELMNYSETTPISFGLIKNYPNPFNPTTTIDFNLDVDSNIILAIYDINGKMIKEIKNEYLESGYYSISWNGKNSNNLEVSSGTYICKLISDGYSDQIKLLLIK